MSRLRLCGDRVDASHRPDMRHSPARFTAIVLLLAGCSSSPTIPGPPKEVRIPVAVPCLKPADVPQRPSMLSDAQLDALDDKRAVIALGQDRRVRQAYQVQLEAAIAGCR